MPAHEKRSFVAPFLRVQRVSVVTHALAAHDRPLSAPARLLWSLCFLWPSPLPGRLVLLANHSATKWHTDHKKGTHADGVCAFRTCRRFASGPIDMRHGGLGSIAAWMRRGGRRCAPASNVDGRGTIPIGQSKKRHASAWASRSVLPAVRGRQSISDAPFQFPIVDVGGRHDRSLTATIVVLVQSSGDPPLASLPLPAYPGVHSTTSVPRG